MSKSFTGKFVSCVSCGKAHLDQAGHNFLPKVLEAVQLLATPAAEGLGGCESCSPASLLRRYELRRELARA